MNSIPLLLVFALMAGPALAQAPPSRGDEPTPEQTAERQKRQDELAAVEAAIRDSAAAKTKLDAEIAAVRADRARLNTELIDAAERMRAFEQRLSAIEQRLAGLQSSESAIRQSLQGRRGLIAEVLAALQRMGRKPPPAIFVRPEDILEAVRASIALGAVLPELKAETQTLAQDLGQLVRLRDAIGHERRRIAAEVEGLAAERVRLAALVEARQATLRATEKNVGEEARRAAELARQAGTIRDLLQKIESDIRQARLGEEARRAEEARIREAQGRLASLSMRDPARLAPKLAFPETRGTLQMPVEGPLIRVFGAADDAGAPSRGQTIEARPGAVVTSPADGWVAFAGPFRSFGRLLILNAGGGYYIVLAGMERINVDPGQFVLAGEPVAVMGSSVATMVKAGAADGAAPASELRQSVLYVEFRKDGASIDPGPWWARSDNGKVRG